jgi:hypothetical protein
MSICGIVHILTYPRDRRHVSAPADTTKVTHTADVARSIAVTGGARLAIRRAARRRRDRWIGWRRRPAGRRHAEVGCGDDAPVRVGGAAVAVRMGNNGRVTSATTVRATGARPKLDPACAQAVDLARDAVIEDVAGPHIEAVAEGERLVTHYFECAMPGYRGWRWAVTVARAPRSRQVTVCETVLLPGPDALVAPPWVPWEDRVAPGDLGVGDLMPTPSDDERLAPGYLLSDDPAVEDVVWELGLGRVRVMSREGRLDAADRWYEGDRGPRAPIATAAPPQARCVTCGFYLPLAGSMRAVFGVCGNVYAPDDAKVVSGDHGCGAHSEVLLDQPDEVDEAPTIYDDSEVDVVEVAPPDAAPPTEAV